MEGREGCGRNEKGQAREEVTGNEIGQAREEVTAEMREQEKGEGSGERKVDGYRGGSLPHPHTQLCHPSPHTTLLPSPTSDTSYNCPLTWLCNQYQPILGLLFANEILNFITFLHQETFCGDILIIYITTYHIFPHMLPVLLGYEMDEESNTKLQYHSINKTGFIFCWTPIFVVSWLYQIMKLNDHDVQFFLEKEHIASTELVSTKLYIF